VDASSTCTSIDIHPRGFTSEHEVQAFSKTNPVEMVEIACTDVSEMDRNNNGLHD
jgi:hypothetical protein